MWTALDTPLVWVGGTHLLVWVGGTHLLVWVGGGHLLVWVGGGTPPGVDFSGHTSWREWGSVINHTLNATYWCSYFEVSLN